MLNHRIGPPFINIGNYFIDTNTHTQTHFDRLIDLKKIESNPNVMDSFMMGKSTLKRFGFIKTSSRLCDGEKIVA